MNTVQTKSWNSGIDLLRIVAMVMVVTHHFLGHGGVLDTAYPLSVNWCLSWLAKTICYTSVTMFFLMSAYFQSRKSIGLIGILKIWLQVWFYSVLCYAASCVIGWTQFGIASFVKALFPVMFRQYGFFNGYLLMAVLSPFLNIAINGFTRRTHFCLILMLSVMCCVIPYISFVDAFNIMYGEGALWIILLYLVAAYIFRYHRQSTGVKRPLLLGLALCIIQFLSKVAIAIVTKSVMGEILFSGAFIGETPIISLIASILIFVAFRNLGDRWPTRKKSGLIRFIAPLVFSVYLVHESNNIRWHLWALLNPSRFANGPLWELFLAWIAMVGLIFLVAMFVEKIRLRIDARLQPSTRLLNFVLASKAYRWINRKLLGLDEKNGKAGFDN